MRRPGLGAMGPDFASPAGLLALLEQADGGQDPKLQARGTDLLP